MLEILCFYFNLHSLLIKFQAENAFKIFIYYKKILRGIMSFPNFLQQLYLIKTNPFSYVWDFLLFSTHTIKFPTQTKYFIRDYQTEAVPLINSPLKFLLKERNNVPCGYEKT